MYTVWLSCLPSTRSDHFRVGRANTTLFENGRGMPSMPNLPINVAEIVCVDKHRSGCRAVATLAHYLSYAGVLEPAMLPLPRMGLLR
jgi:hypothetical protein